MLHENRPKPSRSRRFSLLAALFLFGALPAGSGAISDFSIQRDTGQEPAPIDFDDLWFYDEDRSKRIPDINPSWVAAALNEDALRPSPLAFDGAVDLGEKIVQRAKEAIGAYDEIVDVFYDPNLAEDACFFALREGMTETGIQDLIRSLNREAWVAYTHPALIVRGRAVAYFDAFEMEWKTGVEDAWKQALMAQAHIRYEPGEEIYRVNVLAMPFFKAVNLLAEDIRVAKVVPILVPLEPSIRVELSVPLQGCQIGDRIPFALRIEFSDRIRIDPSSLVNINLRPGDIQRELVDIKFDPYDYVKAASQSPLTLTGWMKIYAPGEFAIPPVEIHYECTTCSGEPVHSIKTDAIPLKVASLVPSKGLKAEVAVPEDDVHPLLPTESLREKARTFLWQAAVSLVVAAALLGCSARRWVALKRERQGPVEERQEDALAERLRAYLAEDPERPHWQVAGEAGRQLRAFVVTKYGLDRDPQQGSGEVFFEAVRSKIPAEVASPLRSLLGEIDDMIALETVAYPEVGRWKKELLDLLDLAQSKEA